MTDRAHHCFISYASEDAGLARRLASWLTAAGLDVWLDQTRLSAGSLVVEELTRQLGNSRGCLLVLTEAALKKNYVKHEVDIACEQQVTEPEFALVAVRISPDLDPTARFPALRKLSWMDLPDGELSLESARRLLLALSPGASRSPPGTRHVFVSCGWGEQDTPITRRVCAPLARRGVQLIGDATDQRQFGANGRLRIERIMSGCGGHLIILPVRRSPGKSPEESYKYFLAEWEIGRELGLARRIFCISRNGLPGLLRDEAIEVGTGEDPSGFERELVALHDETDRASPYVFLAVDYQRTGPRNEAARDLIEHVLGMECWLGRDYPGEQLIEAIVEKVIGANLVFADLAPARDEPSNRLDPNLNSCIEAGIALGARKPVFLTALDPESFDPAVRDKTSQIPFSSGTTRSAGIGTTPTIWPKFIGWREVSGGGS
ncbi:MAG: toll/interleukin-1 receptor domain-containing protein [Gemmatimonadales bacterium]